MSCHAATVVAASCTQRSMRTARMAARWVLPPGPGSALSADDFDVRRHAAVLVVEDVAVERVLANEIPKIYSLMITSPWLGNCAVSGQLWASYGRPFTLITWTSLTCVWKVCCSSERLRTRHSSG